MDGDDMANRQVGQIELGPEHIDALDRRVATPKYDRAALGAGIVHVGVGGFHRAHQAVYLDDLCNAGYDAWSITGAGVLQADKLMADALKGQGGLYTLITRDRATTDVRVIGSIVDYIYAFEEIAPLVASIADPATKIVSLTITEGGYPVDEGTGRFLPSGDGILPPAFEAIVGGLEARRAAGAGGLTILSCDNVMHNGATAREATVGAAATLDDGLANWIATNVSFPNSMVDRITPATTQSDREYLATEYGIIDRWPVVAEKFTQWVIEDEFAAGRPAWEDVGVLFTNNVEPYETLKLRLLNAGHSCLAYLAALAGHTYVHEVMGDEPFATYLRSFLDNEATPALPPVPGVDVSTYKSKLAERFAIPSIRDQVSRLCLDGTSKFPKFLIPTIESQLRGGGSVALAALALAGWCQYLTGSNGHGKSIELAADPNLSVAVEYATASVSRPRDFLGFTQVLGDEVAGNAVFEAAFTEALASLRSDGVHSTLNRFVT